MENINNQSNINEQLKNLTPEAVENAQAAMFRGQINFIKKSPLKYFYIIFIGLFILIVISIGVSAVKMHNKRKEFDKEFEETKRVFEQVPEFIQDRMNEMNE